MKKTVSVLLAVCLVFLQAASMRAKALVPLEFVELVTVENITAFSPDSFVSKKNSLVFTDDSEMFVDVSYDIAGSSNKLRVQYDSRNYGYVTSVKNQGSTGGCWAFCAMSALESDSIMKGYADVNEVDYSEAHLVWFGLNPVVEDEASPVYGDGTNFENPYFYGGNWLMAAAALSRWNGVAPDSEFPYHYNDVSLMGNYDESERYNTDTGVIVKSVEALLDQDDIKGWIVDHGSVMALIYYENSYLYNKNGEYSYYYNGTNGINHAITIVGWDDSYAAANFSPDAQPSVNGAWLCKNSWGSNYANGGYFWLSYADASVKDFAGFSAQKADTYRHNYTYNGAYWESAVTHSGSAQVASVFETTEYESLAAVSTYTLQPSTDITVYIYHDLKSDNPTDGTLASTYSTTLERSGYHTIELPDEVHLAPETDFSVVLELSHSTGTVYIPVENPGGTNAYSSKAGQSYLNLPAYNEGWYDVQAYGVHNTYIQAFTKCDHQNLETLVAPTCIVGGELNNVCMQCGLTELIEAYDATGHEFGEWSDFESVDGSSTQVSSRECANCDHVENRSYIQGNVLTLTDLFRMIFESFINVIISIFS